LAKRNSSSKGSKRLRPFSTLVLCLTVLAILLVACGEETDRTTRGPGTSTAGPTGTPAPSPTPTLLPPPTNDLIRVPATPTRPVSTGGSVTGAFIREADTLHYYRTTNPTSFEYLRLLFAASLTRRNPATLELENNAAQSWTVDAASATVTFKLKEGLKWSDGQPIEADDYLWTYEQARKPDNGWFYASGAFSDGSANSPEGIVSYAATDTRTLVIKLKSYSFDIVSRADVIEPLPRHIWEKLDWKNPSRNPEINKPSVVSGPWLLKEWKKGEFITFTRNSSSSVYPVPMLDSFTYRIVNDSQVALQLLKTGEIDFYYPENDIYSAFEALPNAQVYRWTPARATFYYMGFNFRNSFLQDKRLRQALALATDKAGILAKNGSGLGRLMYSSISPWHPYYQDSVPKFAYDTGKATEFLRNAGYTISGSKLLNQNRAEIPVLKLIYEAPSPVYSAIAQNLKQSYAALGLTLEIEAVDFTAYQRLLVSGTNYDLFLGGWNTDYDPENLGEIWQNVPALNFGAYRNDRLIDLYRNAKREPDFEKRRVLMAQVQQIEADELPYIYLFVEYGRASVNRRIAGVSQTYDGVGARLFTDWYILKP
jgi:peptide/nickel transport system substrate-binding protein